jgi:hypothetical protein
LNLPPPFERSVFVNCPFDDDYEPILQAILFCIIYLGFAPRISRERNDSGEVRLQKIRSLIEGSLYSIHDLSRSQARKKGEHFRLNMPFELGIDYACREYLPGREAKRLLVLDEKPYRYQAALSDIAGCDIEYHGGDYQKGVRKVRNWLVSEAGVEADGAARVLARYADFQGWYYDKQLAAGFSDEDIKDYPTNELLRAMQDWVDAGKPVSWTG